MPKSCIFSHMPAQGGYHQETRSEPLQLKLNVKRKHQVHAIHVEEKIKTSSSHWKHRQSSSCSTSSQSKQIYVKKHASSAVARCLPKLLALLYRKIVNLFIDNMLLLYLVDLPTFVGLFKALNTCKMLMSKVLNSCKMLMYCCTLNRVILASHK